MDTDIQHAALVSKLSGNPALVKDSVFVWNGLIIDRATALVALLKVYCLLPVNDSMKNSLFSNYKEKFAQVDERYLVRRYDNDDGRAEINKWFSRVCRIIKGSVETRDEEAVKQLIIQLHS